MCRDWGLAGLYLQGVVNKGRISYKFTHNNKESYESLKSYFKSHTNSLISHRLNDEIFNKIYDYVKNDNFPFEIPHGKYLEFDELISIIEFDLKYKYKDKNI
ncbi:hypothetical protein CIG11343_0166 [Campylobacter iguaniorum]|nr:hypothetical protein CIG11343_0166 [Campylobacter iguaniorum]